MNKLPNTDNVTVLSDTVPYTVSVLSVVVTTVPFCSEWVAKFFLTPNSLIFVDLGGGGAGAGQQLHRSLITIPMVDCGGGG
jgi:hypothetical protein